MHSHTAEWIASRVKWKMRRFSSPEMILFPEGETPFASTLTDVAAAHAAGMPIMAFWRSNDLWTLIGSDKLVWAWDGEVGALVLDTLKKVEEETLDEEAESVPKRLLETLHVMDANGSTFRVWGPLDGLWRLREVLAMLIGMQKKP
jgi:hypothetical protein